MAKRFRVTCIRSGRKRGDKRADELNSERIESIRSAEYSFGSDRAALDTGAGLHSDDASAAHPDPDSNRDGHSIRHANPNGDSDDCAAVRHRRAQNCHADSIAKSDGCHNSHLDKNSDGYASPNNHDHVY